MERGFLPPEVQMVVSRDDGHKADRTVTCLAEYLFIAIAAVTLVLSVLQPAWQVHPVLIRLSHTATRIP